MRTAAITLLSLFVLNGLVQADEPKDRASAESTVPGPFRALVISNPDIDPLPPTPGVLSEDRKNRGDHARVGKFHDFITHYGLDPVVAIWSRELPGSADQPLGKFLKALDQTADANRNARLHAFVIFLTLKGEFLQDEAQPAQTKQIEGFAQQLALKTIPLSLDRTESDRTKAYNIPADATLVIWLYSNQKVKNRFTFTTAKPFDDAAATAILGDVKKMIDMR